MNIAGNHSMMAGGAKRTPYIETSSSRNQYIDTGLVGRTDYNVALRFIPYFNVPGSGSGLTWINTVFGYEDWSDSAANGRFEMTNWPSFSGGSFFVGGVDANPKMAKDALCEIELIGNTLKTTDGATTVVNRRTYTAPHNAHIYLFANNLYHDYNRNYAARYAWLRFYEMKIWNASNVLLRHFVPMQTGGGAGVLYDSVTDAIYANQGSGSFVYGEE